MDAQVDSKIGGETEGLPALLALVGLLPSVRLLMLGQVGLLREGLAAHLAGVGLLPGVDPLVLLEVRLAVEGLPALEALEGLLPGVVVPPVADERCILDEGLPAVQALVRLLARVDALVPFQVVQVSRGIGIFSSSPGNPNI